MEQTTVNSQVVKGKTISLLPRAIALAIFALLSVSCQNLDDLFDDFFARNLSLGNWTDQGYIHFDDTGNIHVEFNNTVFKNNPLYSTNSFLQVFVYERGADPYRHCCTGSTDCTSTETKSCLRGIGFSNDLGFAGEFFILQHPLEPFNPWADRYYMPVYASGKDARPENFQGEYNTFSSPVATVGDREQFDLYLGIYYSIWDDPGANIRVVTDNFFIGEKEYYTPVKPDLISPLIEIESRFFRQSPDDPTGSFYVIPWLTDWKRHPGFEAVVDRRRSIVINEIANAVGGVTTNEYIELYNPTGEDIDMSGASLRRWTDTACDSLGGSSNSKSLTGITVPAGGYVTLWRSDSGNTPALASGFVIGDNDCIALTTDSKDVTSPFGANVIDFVGLEDRDNLNPYRGSGAAPPTGSNVVIGRCANGVNTGSNAADWHYILTSPDAANNCAGVSASTLYTTSFEGGEPDFVDGGAAQPTFFPASCGPGTSARSGSAGIFHDDIITTDNREIQSVDCIALPLTSNNRAVYAEFFLQASAANGSNDIQGRVRFLWFSDNTCATSVGTSGTNTPIETAAQGSYTRVMAAVGPPTTAGYMKLEAGLNDTVGATTDDFCLDDAQVRAR